MIQRFRIGNNLSLIWLLYEDDGNIHNLEGKELELYMTCGGLKFVVTDYTVTENAVAWVFPAALQTRTGYYKLVLLERDPQRGLYSFDVAEAFCLEPEDALTNIETIIDEDSTVQVRSVLTYAHITNLASVDTIESADGWSAVIRLTNGKSFSIPLGGDPGGQSVEVVDNLNSNSSTNALSARQGKVLKGMIDGISETQVVNNLASTSTSAALSANMGRVLKELIDSIEPGGGGGATYSAGDGIDITSRVVSLKPATANTLGGIKVGLGLTIDSQGVLSATGGGGDPSDGGVNTLYSSESAPGTPDTDPSSWHVSKGAGDIWLAVQFKENGVWGPWAIISIGDYEAVYASFKSFVFKRSDASSLSAPTGGSYSNPYPTDTSWSDGIPSGTGAIWMSTRIFTSDDNAHGDANWSTPKVISDTGDMDYEFSSAANPGTPSKATPTSAQTNPNWSDTADTTTIWMAMRKIKNEAYVGDWMVTKIKGENGADGTSVKILGTLPSSGDLPDPYTGDVGDGYLIDGDLWVWDGDNWVDCGAIKGEDGDDGQTPFIHIKYGVKVNDAIQFTASSGESPEGATHIGIYWDYDSTDSSTVGDYTWSEWKGQDGFGYEYIFKLTSTSTAPELPSSSPNTDNYVPPTGGWTDDPGGVSSANPYCWVAWRKKEDGVWSSWYGTTNGRARLYAYFADDGTDGYNTAIVYLYKRASSAPVIEWSSTLTYTFSTHSLNAVPAGWSATIPANNGNPLYVTAATAASRGSTDTIAYNEWSTPVMLTEDGTDGLNSATVLLYQRASSTPNVPGGTITYTFADGSLSGNLGGWTKTVPATDGNPCYCIQATAVSTGATDDILSSEWTSPLLILRDGQDGTSAMFPFVGEFSTSGTYYGNPSRTDIVKYNGYYYIAKSDAPTAADGTFSGSATGAVPGTSGSAYWTLMNTYTNVATDTLFAEGANVANFLFSNGVLRSVAESSGQPKLVLDGNTGNLYAINATIKGNVQADSGNIGPLVIDQYGLRGEYENTDTSTTIPKLEVSSLEVSIKEIEFESSLTRSSQTTYGRLTIGMDNDGFVDIQGEKSIAGGFSHVVSVGGDVYVAGPVSCLKKVARSSELSNPVSNPFSSVGSNGVLYVNSSGASVQLPKLTTADNGICMKIACRYDCILTCNSSDSIKTLTSSSSNTTANLTSGKTYEIIGIVESSSTMYWLIM